MSLKVHRRLPKTPNLGTALKFWSVGQYLLARTCNFCQSRKQTQPKQCQCRVNQESVEQSQDNLSGG